MTSSQRNRGAQETGGRALEELSGVVILGTGRSGTSAIARAFARAGFFVGREADLYPAAPSNPLGHYEALSILSANEKLLESFGRYWWADAPPVDEQMARREEVGPHLSAILDSLFDQAGDRPLAIKEPRINSLLPLWQPVLEGRMHPVLTVRDPLEIALSHAHRDGTSTAHALAAWEHQSALVLSILNGKEVTVAPYGELISAPELAAEVVRSAASRLRPDLKRQVEATDAPGAIDPAIRNESTEGRKLGDYLTERQLELWRYLGALPPGDAVLSAAEPLRQPSDRTEAILRAESERVRAGTEYARTEKERIKLLDGYNSAVDQVADAERQLDDARRQIDDARHQISDAQKQLLELDQRLSEATAAREKAETDATRERSRRLREVADVRISASWRLTAPLREIKTSLRRRRS